MKSSELSNIIKTENVILYAPESEFNLILTDSRKLTDAKNSLFFAIPTKRNNGCRYIQSLYTSGVRNFVVPDNMDEEFPNLAKLLQEANIWYVKNVVKALQQLATSHRQQFSIPVVGITGSNGKTIVKDWIVQMLSADRHVVSSPKSFNSQIGVPLSVWQMAGDNEFAVFEAGISEPGEMDNLRKVISPSIGIFTNIGQAHDEHFLSRQQKIAEKLTLFIHCDVLIYCTDHKEIHTAILERESMRQLNHFTWGSSDDNAVVLKDCQIQGKTTILNITHNGESWNVVIPFLDRASVENAMHCITLLLYLGYSHDTIAERCLHLSSVAMRLEMNEGINNCLLINDSYSLDFNSLSIALEYLQREQQNFKKTVIISDFVQSGIPAEDLYPQVAQLMRQRNVSRIIGIGEHLCRHKELFDGLEGDFYPTTELFIAQHQFSSFQSESILLKGARMFGFEKIAHLLQRKSHETIMEVNLDALVHNMNYYRSKIKPTTKLMCMVKASSYGAGKVEVASALQFNHADYLTVAYSDEGVELRRNGITLPIMVMNPEEDSFDDIIKYQLEPDIYSERIFNAFSETVKLLCPADQKIPVHVEFDTGMHRLGFGGRDIDRLTTLFSAPDCVLEIKSIFSHLACADDPEMDDFTHIQLQRFSEWSSALKQGLGRDDILCSILNSSGIERFSDYQFDMVRLGIGLYGISPMPEIQSQLQSVSRLKTKISQIKSIPYGDSVGYNRRWIARRESRIAIIPIGYADGLNRHLGYEHGHVMIHGKRAPIIGSICMDMCFIDVTDIDCSETDEVVIFGDEDLLQRNASAAGTITYEILTSVAPRVKRIYYQE